MYENSDGVNTTVDAAEVPGIEDIEKDEYVLVNMSKKDTCNHATYEVVKVSPVEIMTDSTVTRFSKKNSSDSIPALFSSVTSNGTKYDASYQALYSEDVLDLYDNRYILSEAKAEGRDSDGNYYWEFDAVVDGEIREGLVVRSKFSGAMDEPVKNHVQEPRFDGEYVIGVEDVADVYGENGVKTQYDSVADAIAALGDPATGTPELEYKGRITAVLNSSGVAKWVVFNSDKPVTTGSGNTGNGREYTITVSRPRPAAVAAAASLVLMPPLHPQRLRRADATVEMPL